jgi:hypothetical protein
LPQAPGYEPVLMSPGQVMTGLSTSRTSTWKLQVEVLPLESRAVQFTVVVPFPKFDPDGGVQDTETPGQLSLMLGLKLTIAVHWPGGVMKFILPGQMISGRSLSTTRTVNAHTLVLPLMSVAVHVTVFVPFGKSAPDGGLQVSDATPQLSVALVV